MDTFAEVVTRVGSLGQEMSKLGEDFHSGSDLGTTASKLEDIGNEAIVLSTILDKTAQAITE